MKKTDKYIEDSPHQVVYSTQNISLNDIHKYRILFGVISNFFRSNSWKGIFSPVTIDILNNLPLLSFVPAFFQVWCLCRFSEIKQISVQDIKKFNNFEIKSTKSTFVKSVDHLPILLLNNVKSIKDRTKILVVSYDSYKNSIKECLNILNFLPKKNIQNCTHIFRHLEASFLYSRGVPVPDISYKLGHQNENTTLEYIHKEWRF